MQLDDMEFKAARPTRRVRTAARALGLGLAALALAAGSAAASTQIPTGPGGIVQAVGSKVATVYTSVHGPDHVAGTSFGVGLRIHPALVVTGNDGTPTGTVSGYFYESNDCTGPSSGYGRTLPANATLDDSSLNWTSNVATTNSLRIKYEGDATYAAAWGPCRAFTFTKLDPTITVQTLDWNGSPASAVPFNQGTSARVTVAGSLDTPTSFVLVRSWANATCDGSDYDYTTKQLDGSGVADEVLYETFDAPGVRSYKAHYAGNGSYNGLWSDCVAVEGTKIAAAQKFVLHDDNHVPAPVVVPLGTSIHVVTGATGQAGQPTGTITAHVYTGANCQTQAYQQSVPAAASIDDGSFGKAFPGAPSVISWKIEYSGDANYLGWTSACSARQFLAQATITVAVHDASHNPVTSIVLGGKVHLSVTVTGAFGAITGPVALDADETSACSNGAAYAFVNLVGDSSDDASNTFKPHAVETVWFHASYAGDGTTYGYSRSACVAIQVTPAPATPAPGATPAPTTTPTSAPSAAPSATPVVGSTAGPASPTATDAPVAAPTSGPTTPAASKAPGSTAAPAAGPVTPSAGASGGGTLVIIFGVGLLALAVGLAVWFIAGRRRGTEQQRVGEPLASA